MREIKFRGKNLNKLWVYGWLRQTGHEDIKKKNGQYIKTKKYYQIQNEKYNSMFIDEETIGQYTGLHDKNGKEIYEGDIVTFNLKSDAKGCPNIIGYIEYQTTFSSFRIMSILGSFALDDNIKEIEVIGNLYDNSELLKEE